MSKAWMPMYWGDYLADTAHFTNAEHGAYMLLIGFYWTNGKLPADEEAIRRIAKCSAHQWKKIRPVLVEKFSITNCQWTHKRIDAELAQAIEKSEVGRANAMLRWHPVGNANHNHNHNHKESKKEDTANAVPSPNPKYAFESGVIRLSEKDFALWETAFRNLDLRAELLALQEWAAGQPKWFFAVSSALAKRNREIGLKLKIEKEKPNVESDKDRRKRESREALDKLQAFGEGRSDGDLGAEIVRLLPSTRAGGGSGGVSDGGS